MKDEREILNSDEMIDLRDLIQSLWKKKWIILGITVLAGLVSFAVTEFLVQERYQASAFLTITDPGLRAELETSILANEVDLETSGLPDLAESAELQDLTFAALSITGSDERSAFELSSTIRGEDQLKLTVIASDSFLAADAANTWASVVVNRLNTLYGFEVEDIQSLEQEVTEAKDNWSATQLALEDYLPESQLNSSELQLSAARSILAKFIKEIDSNQLLISDIKTLKQQVDNQPSTENISIGTVISLITLQQRAAAIQNETNVQIQIDQAWKVDISSEYAIVILVQLIDALENQNQELQQEILTLESEISDIVLSQEKEQYRIDLLKQERDLARLAYTALSSQLKETRIIESSSAKIGAKAIVPTEAISPKTGLITGLGSTLGLLVVVGYFFLNAWLHEDY